MMVKSGGASVRLYANSQMEMFMKNMKSVLIIAGVLASPLTLASDSIDAGRQYEKAPR